MTHHLSTWQVEQLCVSALPKDELVAAAVHTTECQSCNQQFIEALKRQRSSKPFKFTLAPEFWFGHDHLDFDQLVGLADNTFDKETLEIINIHLSSCETCREDVRSFLAFQDATAREISISYIPTYVEASDHRQPAPWWQLLQTRPGYSVAAIVLLAIAVIIGVIGLSGKFGSPEANKQDQANADLGRSPGLSPSSAPNVVSNPSSVDDSAKVAVLDAGGEVTIDTNGRVTGLDQVSETSRQYVAQASLSRRIEPADVLRHLSGEQSGLRSSYNGPNGFRLLYPARSVVVENQPVFRWEGLPDASSYRVYAFDANGNQVAQSEELSPTQTQWRALAPLRRGQIFSWVATAVVNGKNVVSPSASAPEMKFAVLSTADFKELTSLKKAKSHLALGVFYARAGLLDEAERELESLIKLNPQSELPRNLLQSVRAKRKAD